VVPFIKVLTVANTMCSSVDL